MEKQRRKAARESRASIAPPTLLGDVARRASGIFNPASVATVNGRPVSRSRSLRESFMSGKEDMVGGGSSRRRPTTNDSANYVELGSDGPPGLGGVKEGPDEEDDDVGTIVNGDYDLGVTGSPPSTRKTRRSHTARRSSAGSVDTFATTRSGPENPFSSQHGQIPLDEPFTPPRQPVSQQPQSTHLQVPQPTKATRNRKGKSKTAPLPAPQPLDLPAADYHSQQPPSSEMSHWRRVQEDRILAELEEEEEIDRRSGGRWWTDWLCGCREGGRGSRDDQVGRTRLPFLHVKLIELMLSRLVGQILSSRLDYYSILMRDRLMDFMLFGVITVIFHLYYSAHIILCGSA